MSTILLADDNAGNREIARITLEMAGYNIIEAADGQEALELARKEMPALLILDIQMPKLDGYAVIRELRREPQFATIPAVAMTAYAMRSDHDAAIAAGFTCHVTKPVDLSGLRKLVGELLSDRRTTTA